METGDRREAEATNSRRIYTRLFVRQLLEAERLMKERGIPWEGRRRAIQEMKEAKANGYVDPHTH